MKYINNLKIKSILVTEKFSIFNRSLPININDVGIDITIDNFINVIKLSDSSYNIKNIFEYFDSFLRQLNVTEQSNIPIYKLIGKTKSSEYINYIKSEILKYSNILTEYHTNIFKQRKSIYSNLNKVLMNNLELDIPQYEHNTTTGRTSIKSGYNFLTMKKEDKMKLTSSIDNHTLVEIDFKSCEPYFYLNSIGMNINDDDVYNFISNKINYKFEDRNRFKRSILSLIYGANENTIAKIMQVDISIVKKIKSIFEIEKTKSHLEELFNENNMIYNFYGRPILTNTNLINHWIQSSAVDYCSLAFNNFVKEYNLKPCFVIHDSLTFAIENNRLKELDNIKYLSENISGFKIPVKINIYK